MDTFRVVRVTGPISLEEVLNEVVATGFNVFQVLGSPAEGEYTVIVTHVGRQKRHRLAELMETFRQEGFEQRTPEWIRPEILKIDQDAARESRCEDCGHQGMLYMPFHDKEKAYRIIEHCPNCAAAEEF